MSTRTTLYGISILSHMLQQPGHRPSRRPTQYIHYWCFMAVTSKPINAVQASDVTVDGMDVRTTI